MDSSCRFLLAACLQITSCLSAGEHRVVVKAPHAGPSRMTMVRWRIPESERGQKPWDVVSVPTQDKSAGQTSESGEELHWLVPCGESSDDQQRYLLTPRPATPVTNSEMEMPIALRAGDDVIAEYQTRPRLPEGVPEVYRRSGHLHPLRTPSGRIVTDEFPSDHLHQHGIFFAWVNSEFRGRHVDFWNQSKRSGNVEHVAVESFRSGKVFSEARVRLNHLDLTEKKPVCVLRESLQVSAFRLNDVHVLDIISNQKAVAEPLTVKKYHYGGFGVRGSAEWGEKASFLTSEGNDRISGDQQPTRWVRLTGPVDGQICGLAVLGHPENFRASQPVRLHPSMPYFAFSPCIAGEFQITAESSYVSRYRVLAFDGELTADQLQAYWDDYADPVEATTETDVE